MMSGRFISNLLLDVLDVSFFSCCVVFVVLSVWPFIEHQMNAELEQFRVPLLVDVKNGEYEDDKVVVYYEQYVLYVIFS